MAMLAEGAAVPVRGVGRRRGVRVLAGLAIAAVIGTAFMGFLHTRAGRPLLALMGVGCPARRVTPAQAEDLRQRGLATMRGSAPAPSRPALGLNLDVSTEGDVSAWADRVGFRCRVANRGLHQLACSRDGSTTQGGGEVERRPTGDVTFAFDPAGRLVSVDVFRSGVAAATAAQIFTERTAELRSVLGDPSIAAADATAGYLSSGAMRTARVVYRFSNYVASVTAMNLPPRGVVLREQYQSATMASAGPS